MKEFDFDALMDEVLREDAQVEPRPGMERRVMSRVEGEGRLSRPQNRWWGWLLVPAAACVGIAAAVWYVSDGGVSQHDRIALRVSPPALTVPVLETPKIVSARPDVRVSPAGQVDRGGKRVRAASEKEPKLETFPAVSQKGDISGWLGSSDGGKLAAIAREASPETVAAYQQLRSAQNEPIDIAAIEIKPLQ
jgi:hypothetical protein